MQDNAWYVQLWRFCYGTVYLFLHFCSALPILLIIPNKWLPTFRKIEPYIPIIFGIWLLYTIMF